jgi:SAM-dependent methyltransferase
MIRQRPTGSAPVVQASATHLPFRDAIFAAALAVLTVHHWPDRVRGLTELARVAQHRLVIVTWDPATSGFWLVEDYFPAILEIDRQILPPMEELRQTLGTIEVRPLPVPYDCTDGFLGAYWRRPHAYLDPGVRGAISTFAKISNVESGLSTTVVIMPEYWSHDSEFVEARLMYGRNHDADDETCGSPRGPRHLRGPRGSGLRE